MMLVLLIRIFLELSHHTGDSIEPSYHAVFLSRHYFDIIFVFVLAVYTREPEKASGRLTSFSGPLEVSPPSNSATAQLGRMHAAPPLQSKNCFLVILFML